MNGARVDIDERQCQLEQLDALWATFRLPVPIATKGGFNNSSQLDQWLFQALDLLRLLHTMNNHNTACASTARSREQIMSSQMMRAISLLAEVERTFPSPQQQMSITNNAQQADQQMIQHNFHHLMQKLRSDTDDTCAKFQRWLDRQQQQMPQERDLIYDIFLAPAEDPPTNENEYDSEQPLDDFHDDDIVEDNEDDIVRNNANTQTTNTNTQRRQRFSPPKKQEVAAVEPMELQKQQQQLLEEELSSMATRLKSSTLAMNATLQSQTKELGDMEELAQTNLDQVADTTQKVEDRLARKRGWKKRLATWSLIGTIIGMWVLCFMVMKTLPKRKVGKARWFGKEKTTKQQKVQEEKWQWNWQQQERQRQEQEPQECEILSDGTQVCSNSKDEAGRTEAKAHQLAAERKRRRIEEKMANAPAVDAVDSVEDEETDYPTEEIKDSSHIADSHDDDQEDSGDTDPMGCVPLTDEIQIQQNAITSFSSALARIVIAVENSPLGSTERMEILRQQERFQSEVKKHGSLLELEKNKARSVWWADRANRIKAREQTRALGSVPFCKEPDYSVGDEEEEDDERDARLEAARRREEQNRAERERRQKEFQEEARLAEEAQRLEEERSEQRRNEEERERIEQLRLAAEASKQAQLEKIEKERLEQERLAAEEAERERERLADEAAKQVELEKLEQARLEAERLEKERLAAEALDQERIEAEKRRSEADVAQEKEPAHRAMAEAEDGAKQAMEASKQVGENREFIPSDVRFAAGRSKNDMLAYYIRTSPDMVDASDRSGWAPIHEAARAGNSVGVQLLVSAGADLTTRTGRTGNGGTPLWWAIQRFGQDHSVVQLLRSHGAPEAGSA